MPLLPLAITADAHAEQLRTLAAVLDPALVMTRARGVCLLSWEGDSTSLEPLAVIAWIRQLHAAIDILPIQWGQTLGSHTEALDLLNRTGPQLLDQWMLIVGRTEFVVQLPAEPPAATGPASSPDHPVCASPGRTYLARRAAHYAAEIGLSREVSRSVHAWLAALDVPTLKTNVEPPSRLVQRPRVLLSVLRPHAPALRARYNATRDALGVPSTLTGPWAPTGVPALAADRS